MRWKNKVSFIAYFLSNVSAKSYQNRFNVPVRQSYSKTKYSDIFETQCRHSTVQRSSIDVFKNVVILDSANTCIDDADCFWQLFSVRNYTLVVFGL